VDIKEVFVEAFENEVTARLRFRGQKLV
jgi:hypothetical protein